ncbi:MAG: prepilin-type N-terminal cleavage/methylation domain-containing protein [Mariprofundaceae bacterium]|nr:prepilin-type N-terminal cleavage/methylation domain-containing protein [Mariprofundaceae bacterium]
MLNNHTKQSGFTLVEVMVAMVIVVVGVLALQSFYAGIIRSEQLSQERITAVHMAEQIIEEWQQRSAPPNPSVNPLPTVNCATNPATTLTLGAATACTSSSGAATTFSITPTEARSQAPLPPNHANNNTTGIIWGDMADIGGVTPNIRTVTVSWNYKGATKSIMLTHLTPAP